MIILTTISANIKPVSDIMGGADNLKFYGLVLDIFFNSYKFFQILVVDYTNGGAHALGSSWFCFMISKNIWKWVPFDRYPQKEIGFETVFNTIIY